jgi:hypothetical protein
MQNEDGVGDFISIPRAESRGVIDPGVGSAPTWAPFISSRSHGKMRASGRDLDLGYGIELLGAKDASRLSGLWTKWRTG